MKLCNTQIRHDILDVLGAKFGVTEDYFKYKEIDYLWAADSSFSDIDMVYLMHIVEDRFDVQFNEQDFDNPVFYTLTGMSDIVFSKLQMQNN